MLRGRISEQSQAHVLKRRMEQAGLSHGQEARANLRGVQVMRRTASEGVVYFCNVKEIEVLEVLQQGDGGALPDHAVVEDLQFAKDGSHNLFGVILNSNGVLQVRADEQTRVVPRQWAWW